MERAEHCYDNYLVRKLEVLLHQGLQNFHDSTCPSPALRSRGFKHIEQQLINSNIPILPIEMAERAAFRTMTQLGGTLYDLIQKEVNNPQAAIDNAEALAKSVVTFIKEGAVV